jgi:hypothetical protein
VVHPVPVEAGGAVVAAAMALALAAGFIIRIIVMQ